jgi:hypothetical protein
MLNTIPPEIRIEGDYKVGPLTVYNGTRILSGPGQMLQRALHSNILIMTNVHGFSTDVRFRGAASLGSTPASSNSAIFSTNCSDINIDGAFFDRFLFIPVYNSGGSRIRINNCTFLQNALGPRFRGTKDSIMSGNIIDGTCLSLSNFTVGFGLDSTDGHSFGICEGIKFTDNFVKNLIHSQAFLIHGGKNIQVCNNSAVGSIIGISVNPYNTTDHTSDIIIGNNFVDGFTGTWEFGSTGNSGVVVQGGPSSAGGNTPDPSNITLTGNIVRNANRSKKGHNEGGFQIGYTTDLIASGNVINTPCGNGMVTSSSEDELNIIGNIFDSVLANSTGQSNGINCAGFYSSGVVASNTFRSMTTGFNRNVNVALTLGTNYFSGCTNTVI